MNTDPSSSCPPEETPPPIPPSTPVPTDDGGPTSGTDTGTTLDFIFNGPEDSAKGFNGGKMVQHTMPRDGDTSTYIFSLRGGPHERRTLAELQVTALLGPCTVVIKFGGPTQTLQTGDPPMTIPPGSTFAFETTGKAVLLVTSLGDPGLGGGGIRDHSNL